LAGPRRAGILQGVIATRPSAPAPAVLAAGESVLWRERRTPPIMAAAIACAGMLAVAAVAVGNVVLTPLLGAVAAAALVAGRSYAGRHWLEDQLLTDRRALVVPRVGQAYGLPLDEVDSVEMRGTKALFHGGGRELRFSFVRRHRALRRAIESTAPHVSLEQRWDPNCGG
jgi:hypothetical protein